MKTNLKKVRKKRRVKGDLDFEAGNYVMPRIIRLFEKAGLNWYKFLCGGCSKRSHRNIKTGVWRDTLECEKVMVESIILSLRFSRVSKKKMDDFLRDLEFYIFSKYKPNEMKLRKVLFS